MFAFAVRLRRKPQVEQVVKKEKSSTKVVVLGFMSVFFGGIFFFFETVGKCNCKFDFIGGAMMAMGMATLTFKCIADLWHSMNEGEEIEDEDIETGSMASSYLPDKKNLANGEIYSIYKPILISKELSPANSDLKLIGKQTMRVIQCASKINTRSLKEGYNLPAVVVDT